MSAADVKVLSNLHARLAEVMSEALTSEKARIAMSHKLMEMNLEDLDEATAKAVSDAISLAPTARVDNALLKTISSFLKENNITTDLSTDKTDETKAALDALAGKRTKVGLPTDRLN